MFKKGVIDRFLTRFLRRATENPTKSVNKPPSTVPRTLTEEDFAKQAQAYPASPPTVSRYVGGAWAAKEPHILDSQRRGRLIFKSDRDILENSEYPAEYPSTYIPVEEPEVPNRKARRALGWLYENYRELYNRHRNYVWFNYIDPRNQQTTGVWVAPTATVIGNVWLGDYSSVWYGAVLRGDKNEITIGGYTNIQDGVIITTDDKPNPGGFHSEVEIGNHVTIGHGAKLHACKIGNECIIGMNATVLEGAVVEEHSIVAAGSVVPPGTRIPEGEIWAGNPAKFVRKLGKLETYEFKHSGEEYHVLAQNHALEFTTTGLAYKEVDKIAEEIERRLPVEETESQPEWNVWEKMGEGAAVPIFKDKTQHEDFQKNLNRYHEHEKRFW